MCMQLLRRAFAGARLLGLALRNWDPDTVRGIAIDPVEHLLKKLPDLELPTRLVEQVSNLSSVGWQDLGVAFKLE